MSGRLDLLINEKKFNLIFNLNYHTSYKLNKIFGRNICAPTNLISPFKPVLAGYQVFRGYSKQIFVRLKIQLPIIDSYVEFVVLISRSGGYRRPIRGGRTFINQAMADSPCKIISCVKSYDGSSEV